MPPKPTSKHSQGKRKYNERRYPSTNEVSGPGIWVSCPRGKESATFHELVEVLGTVADDLYPELDLSDPSSSTAPKSSLTGSNATQPIPSPTVPEEDIESQLRRELAEITGAGPSRGVKRGGGEILGDEEEEEEEGGAKLDRVGDGGGNGKNGKGKGKGKGKREIQGVDGRFSHGDLECQSAFFIACKAGINPVKLVQTYLHSVIDSGISRTRHASRLIPTSHNCKAELPGLIELVKSLVDEQFPLIAKELGKGDSPEGGMTYRIEYRERKSSRLNKTDVLQSAPAMAPGWKVALDRSDVVVVIEAYKVNVAVGILKEYELLKKYNVETIIRDHHKASVVEEKNKDVKMWQGNKPEEGQYDFAADVTMEDGQIRE